MSITKLCENDDTIKFVNAKPRNRKQVAVSQEGVTDKKQFAHHRLTSPAAVTTKAECVDKQHPIIQISFLNQAVI